MNYTSKPLRINIGFLIYQPAGYLIEIPFEFDQLPIDENQMFIDLKGVVKLARTQNGLRSLIDFTAQLKVECGRCLELFMLPLNTHFEEIFTFHNRPLSEDEQVIPEDGNIDLELLVRDYLLLEVPINPVCSLDCRGLCSICGENLNHIDCGHDQGEDEESLSPLGLKLSQSLHLDEFQQDN